MSWYAGAKNGPDGLYVHPKQAFLDFAVGESVGVVMRMIMSW